MSTHELGPLPEPIFGRLTVSEDAGYWYECDSPAGEPAFDADQMRAYALAEVARAVAAERAQHQATLALQQRSYEREIELEVEAERERCAKLCDAVEQEDNEAAFQAATSKCAAAIRKGAR